MRRQREAAAVDGSHWAAGPHLGDEALEIGGEAGVLTAGQCSPEDGAGRALGPDPEPDSPAAGNFWGSWCAPCRAEAPDLEATYQATKSLGVEFLGVDVRDGRDAATAFQQDFALTYPSLFDPPGRVVLGFQDVPPNVVPATTLLDKQLRVAVVFRKRVTQRELEAAVRALVAEES